MTTDPIADLLTRIRNAQKAGHKKVSMPNSRIKNRIAELMRDEGYVGEVNVDKAVAGKRGATPTLNIQLKYDEHQRGIIDGIQRVSTPGLRVYRGHAELESVRGGMGLSILSTSRGLMTDEQARAQQVGGEILCRVW